jgi:hypothetical protein
MSLSVPLELSPLPTLPYFPRGKVVKGFLSLFVLFVALVTGFILANWKKARYLGTLNHDEKIAHVLISVNVNWDVT